MIEAVHSLLEEKQQATTFHDLVQEIAQLLGLSEEQVAARIAQFYTDLNIDGRFINLGENRWGLRGWYPYEQIDEEILPQPKPKKKRKVEEDELDDYSDDEEDNFDEDADADDDADEDVDDIDEILDEDDDDLEDLEDDDDFVDDDELEYDESDEEEEEQ